MFPKKVRNWYTQWLIRGPGIQSSLKSSLFHLTPLPIFSDLHTSLSTVQEMKNEQWQAMTLSGWGWCHSCSSGRSKENLAQRNDQSCDLTHLLILRVSKLMRSQNDGAHFLSPTQARNLIFHSPSVHLVTLFLKHTRSNIKSLWLNLPTLSSHWGKTLALETSDLSISHFQGQNFSRNCH